MPPTIRTVFLSSTGKDLSAYRQAVYDAINELDDWKCLRMEGFGARSSTSVDFCRQKVQECDLFVGLIGHCFGDRPKGLKSSFTQDEYNTAIKFKKPRLLFLAKDDLLLPTNWPEDGDQQALQIKFRKRVMKDRNTTYFSDPAGLSLNVIKSIYHYVSDNFRVSSMAT